MLNFGIIYGMSDFGLAERLEIPREEAQRFIDDYFTPTRRSGATSSRSKSWRATRASSRRCWAAAATSPT